MQKLTLQVTEVTDKGATDKTLVAVVASTKSANNLKDSLAENRTFVRKCDTENVFIDTALAEKHVVELVNAGVKDESIRKAITEHIMNALDGACVFYKPPIKRK